VRLAELDIAQNVSKVCDDLLRVGFYNLAINHEHYRLDLYYTRSAIVDDSLLCLLRESDI
jgi:hypothetical protein